MGKYDWRVGKEYREIRYELCDGVAKISINRPERRNAFTPLTVMEMYDAFSEARDDASVGVILLTAMRTRRSAPAATRKSAATADMWARTTSHA